MTLFEFTVFGIYLAMLLLSILFLQIYNPGKQTQEAILDSNETGEEADSDSDVQEEPFDPTKESYTMMENPMLRHRNVTETQTQTQTETETENVKSMNLDEVD